MVDLMDLMMLGAGSSLLFERPASGLLLPSEHNQL